MTINKFQGKTKEEAIEKARKELGQNAVIMNIKEIKPKGIFRAFSGPTYEVTAAVEEKEEFVNPLTALMNQDRNRNREKDRRTESINYAADEKIEIPPLPRSAGQDTPAQPRHSFRQPVRAPQEQKTSLLGGDSQIRPDKLQDVRLQSDKLDDKNIEERLDSLSNMIEERLGMAQQKEAASAAPSSEELNFLRILYRTLIDNEVNEKYVNQIMDEVEKLVRPGKSVDSILANVYQKLILRFGQPETIDLQGKKPKVLFFIGPTGVGKTTTIAKIASKYKVEQGRKVAFITSDTYRIAATEQLRVYANILDAPMDIVYEIEEMNQSVTKMMDYDLIFIDTAGFSHKNGAQKEDIKRLIQGLDPSFNKEVYLVLSATTKYQDLIEIVDAYREIAEYKLIFTKLDETSSYGNILNIRLYSNADLSYVTNGQNVPDDIEIFDTQKIVKQLLGGK